MNQESQSVLKQIGQISIGVLIVIIPFSIIYFGYYEPHWNEEKTQYKQMTCTQLGDMILNETYDKSAVDSQYISNIYGVKCK